jgi:hypothetical protein
VTRTRPSALILLGVIGAVVGWFLELGMLATGRPLVIPPVTFGIALGVIGIALVVLALPVFRVVRKLPGARVDPFYATRVVLLAKASSVAGAAATGVALAILTFVLTRSVLPAVGSVSMSVVTSIGAVVVLVGGLVAEKMCTLPPDDDGSNDDPTEPARS